MVKKKDVFYTIADWRRDNPVETDIVVLINAAKAYALSQVPSVGGESGDPEDPSERFDDSSTALEMAIHRAETAIRLMMEVAQARKVAGLKKRHRGSDISYDPERTSISDPQVQAVLEMLRGKKTKATTYTEVAEIIAPRGEIDERTLSRYIEMLTHIWGQYADPDQNSLWLQNTET